MNNEWENAELYVDLCDETAHKVVHYAGQLKSRLMLTGNEIIGLKELLASERAEWLRSEIEELEKRKFNVVDWLRNTYGLDDDDCLSAGRVQELCEMLVPDAFTSIITRYKEELKVLTGEYE